MNNLTTIQKHSISSLSAKIIAILLILATPVMVRAQSTTLDYATVTTTDTNNSIEHTTLFASTIDQAPDSGLVDSDDDLNKAQRLDDYFNKHDMPLAGYGIEFVRAANKYNVDWRLVAAIGVRESSGGKHMMNNNPFGWGSAKIKFDDFSEAIDVVTSNLGGYNPATAQYYKDTDTKKKLWYYNGSVIKSYTKEVIGIMNMV